METICPLSTTLHFSIIVCFFSLQPSKSSEDKKPAKKKSAAAFDSVSTEDAKDQARATGA